MKIAIIGSRNFNYYELVKKELNHLNFSISEIISGGAKGADSLAELIAKEMNIKFTIIKPEWKKYGRSAGIIRNRAIIEASDFCIAFWDGKSKGTKNGLEICKKMKKEFKIVISN
jgi:hypothetical protein